MSSSAEDDQPTEDTHPVKIMKIIVVGDSFVGKTCLTYRFCKRKFLENTEATIGVDFYEKTIKIGDQRIKVSKICFFFQIKFMLLPIYLFNSINIIKFFKLKISD